jgi:phytoene synthase
MRRGTGRSDPGVSMTARLEQPEPSLPHLLRRHDRDRFLASLYAPPPRRPALWALLGFNYETARVREIVSQPILGQIRLRWWRDMLDEVYGGKPVRRHEVATPLADAIRHHGLARARFDAMIDARERDLLAEEPPATLADLETFLADTSSALLQMQVAVLTGVDGGEAARRIGIAWGLVGLIRALPFHAAAGFRYIPTEIAVAAGLPAQGVAKPSAPLAAALRQLGTAAGDHLAAARARRREVPAGALPALAIARLVGRYLRLLESAGYDPYAAVVQQVDPLAAWRLGWGRLIRRY